jgi:hypothetical protein
MRKARIAHHGAKADIPSGLDLDLTSASFDYRSDAESFPLSATSARFGDAFFVIAKDATGVDRFHVGNQKATFLARYATASKSIAVTVECRDDRSENGHDNRFSKRNFRFDHHVARAAFANLIFPGK